MRSIQGFASGEYYTAAIAENRGQIAALKLAPLLFPPKLSRALFANALEQLEARNSVPLSLGHNFIWCECLEIKKCREPPQGEGGYGLFAKKSMRAGTVIFLVDADIVLAREGTSPQQILKSCARHFDQHRETPNIENMHKYRRVSMLLPVRALRDRMRFSSSSSAADDTARIPIELFAFDYICPPSNDDWRPRSIVGENVALSLLKRNVVAYNNPYTSDRTETVGLFALPSLINHACSLSANIKLEVVRSSGTMGACLLRDVEAGEQLTRDYTSSVDGLIKHGGSLKQLLMGADCMCAQCRCVRQEM